MTQQKAQNPVKIELSDQTHRDLSLLAQAWRTDESEAVARLIAEFRECPTPASEPAPPDAPAASSPDVIGVHADYEGTRVHGEYDVKTQSVRITSGIRERKRFKSPSGAAIAVVTELNPKVNPNRNGWSFWTVTDTGNTLQSRRRG